MSLSTNQKSVTSGSDYGDLFVRSELAKSVEHRQEEVSVCKVPAKVPFIYSPDNVSEEVR